MKLPDYLRKNPIFPNFELKFDGEIRLGYIFIFWENQSALSQSVASLSPCARFIFYKLFIYFYKVDII